MNRKTGKVWVERLVCAHDCGLVINPEALRHTIENGMMHSVSRALYEEVQFDTEKVTSVDWRTHPTLTHADAPAKIDVVEYLGHEELLHAQAEGHEIVALVPSDKKVQVGDDVEFAIPVEKLHVFDPDTEENLTTTRAA